MLFIHRWAFITAFCLTLPLYSYLAGWMPWVAVHQQQQQKYNIQLKGTEVGIRRNM